MYTRSQSNARSLVKAIFTAALIAAALIWIVLPVSAKGPESLTISGPGIDKPLELIDPADPDLVSRFMEQTGLWYGTDDLPRPVEAPTGPLGLGYTLTWINGGPPGLSKAERTIIQFLYLDAPGGPLIHTPPQTTLENWGPGVVGWFSAPSGLRDTLRELGVPLTGGGALSSIIASSQELAGRVGGSASWPVTVAGLAVVLLLARAVLLRQRASQGRHPFQSRVGEFAPGEGTPPGSER